MRYGIVLTLVITLYSCSSRQESAEYADTFQSAYDANSMYTVSNAGIGDITLGGAFELVENNLPVVETETVYEEDDGSGLFLIRLAESDEYNLSVQVGYDDIIGITIFTPPFSTDKGISPQTSNLSDLKTFYTIEDVWVPNSGSLYVGVKELPNVTFVYEDKLLLTLTEGAEVVQDELPGGLVLSKIMLHKPLE
ncbi:MAG: hypothetical protein KF845_12575 [Cyclobacteriaceae bacterium]|nr:hypothetical protein [Cyclobacteriaceae bacterium]